MKTRLFFLTFLLLLLGLGALAQSANSPNSGPVNDIFTSSLSGLDANSYDTLPSHPRFVLLPAAQTAQGESSSQKRPFKAFPNPNPSNIPNANTATSNPVRTGPCQEPAKLFSARDYSGPFSRFAARFTRKPETVTVPAHQRAGKTICSLDAGQKFHLFYKSTLDPVTFIGAGLSAGFSQWNNDDRQFGQGAEGYGKRYGAAMADRASRDFFNKFFYPAIFRQDPRYFRDGQGSTSGRLGHALAHTFVARADSGGSMPNFSRWMGTASTVALANLYHPGRDRGFGSGAVRWGAHMGANMGMDILKEFWPGIVRTFHLPFRERQVVPAGTTGTTPTTGTTGTGSK